MAYIEMAQASGLSLVAPDERDPIGATSVGTGELIWRPPRRAGARHITLGIGGSATTDGGRGLIGGLGDTGDVELDVACDVSNPLLGPNGAAAVYGPQKGATPMQVDRAGCAKRGLGRRAGAHDRPPRARHPRCRRSRRRRVRAPRHPGPLQGVRASARRGPGHGGHGLRRQARARRPRDHRRGPHRRPDRVRQDGARASRSAPRRRACRCIAVGGGVEPAGHRRARRRRRDRGARVRPAASPSRRRWPPARRPSSAAANASRG